jgi:hypothetical protein
VGVSRTPLIQRKLDVAGAHRAGMLQVRKISLHAMRQARQRARGDDSVCSERGARKGQADWT